MGTIDVEEQGRVEQALRAACHTNLRVEWAALLLQASAVVAILLELPILQPVLAFAFLLVVPGTITLHVLRIRLDIPAFMICSLSISLISIIAFGILTNAVYLLVGGFEPFGLEAVVVSQMLPTAAMLAFSLRTVDDRWPVNSTSGPVQKRWLMMILLLPVLSVVGTGLYLNYYDIIVINIAVVLIAAVIPFLLLRYQHTQLTTVLTIWSVSLALLLSTALVSQYIWGWDIHPEASISRRVLELGWWELGFQNKINTMATYTVVTPVYTRMSGLSVSLVLKTLMPIIFSLVAVGIYKLSEEVFERRVAVLAPFVFMFYYGFFKNIAHKQYIAEIFLVTIFVAAFTSGISRRNSKLIMALAAFGLVCSHYATSLLFIPFLAVLVAGNVLLKRWTNNNRAFPVNVTFILLLFSLFVGWYLFVGSGIVIGFIVERGLIELFSVGERVSDPPGRSGAGFLATLPMTIGWRVYLTLSAALVGFTALGIFRQFLVYASTIVDRWPDKNNFDQRLARYDLLAASTFSLVVVGSLLPLGLGIDRMLQLVLVVVAPYCVVGFKFAFQVVNRGISRVIDAQIEPTTVIAMFLAVYLVFSSGVAFLVFPGTVPAHAIAITDNDENGDWNVYNENEVRAAEWLSTRDVDRRIVALGNNRPGKPNYVLLLQGYYEYSHIIEEPESYSERFIKTEPTVFSLFISPPGKEPDWDGPHYAFVGTGSTPIDPESTDLERSVYQKYEWNSSRVYHNGDIAIYDSDKLVYE